jgi:hypothetical protein
LDIRYELACKNGTTVAIDGRFWIIIRHVKLNILGMRNYIDILNNKAEIHLNWLRFIVNYNSTIDLNIVLLFLHTA